MSASVPLHWIKQIEKAIWALDEKPQFAALTPFPWESLAHSFQKEFNQPHLHISHLTKGWEKAKESLATVSAPYFYQYISVAPIKKSLVVLMSVEEIKKLVALFINDIKDAHFIDSERAKAFLQFFIFETLFQLSQLHYASSFSFQLQGEVKEGNWQGDEEHYFQEEVSLSIGSQTAWASLFIPLSFRAAWKKVQASLPPPHLTKENAPPIPLSIALEVGSVALKVSEWKEIKTGDFIVLDSCSYQPDTKSGRAILKLKGHPLFRAKFREGGVKILEYPFHEEAFNTMEDNQEDQQGDEENPLDEMEETDQTDLDQWLPSDEEEQEKKRDKSKESSGQKISFSPEEIPVHLTVAVGSIQMTLHELLELAPGNILEMGISPEEGVDLIIEGKKVGRGELIKVGELLGVRILQL